MADKPAKALRVSSVALLVGVMACLPSTDAWSGDVLFDIETSTGNDTLFVGVSGTINFTVDANGNDLYGLTFPFEMVFSAGNVIGPLIQNDNVHLAIEYNDPFESPWFSSIYRNGNNPDTLLAGFIDFSGPILWDSSGVIWYMEVTASGPGSVRFDSIFLPPANVLAANGSFGQNPPIQYLFDGQVVEFVNPPLGDVLFDVETSTGNDTLFVNTQGTINFTVDANGNEIAGLTFSFAMVFSDGNVIGPLTEFGNVNPSVEAGAAFESISWNTGYGQGTNPDTILYGFIDFGGPLWDHSGTVWSIDVTASGTGTVRFDTIVTPPANVLNPVGPDANDLPWQYLFDGRVVEFVINFDPHLFCNGATVNAETIAIGRRNGGLVFGDDPDGFPAPLTYFVNSAVNDAGTGPNNPFTIDSAGNWSWTSSNENNDDVGNWTVIFAVHDGLDTAICDPVHFTVIAAEPLVCFSFGCAEGFNNDDVCVPLSLDNLLNPCKELGGFDLLFQYDASLLTFTGMDLVGSVLEDAGWEYFTYRVVSSNPPKIRIVAIADMNNSNPHPSDYCIEGLLANVCFRTTNDRNLACQSAHIQFCWDDCGDNTASSRAGDSLFIVADPANGPWVGGIAGEIEGGGIIISSCGIQAQIFTGQGGTTGPADFPCLNSDSTKPDPAEGLYFVNGKIKIRCPGNIEDRGDLNLNAVAYEIADAVLYTNYFILGPSVFGTGETGQAQIAASDVNADGTPLTVADLVYLIRVITGDALPIEGDLLGGGPKVTPAAGTLDIIVNQYGSQVTLRSMSDVNMGAGLFVFSYENVSIAGITALGRASDMNVSFMANAGELRVLVYNIEDGARIEAGSGDILTIEASGTGSIELVSVEAASSLGGILESNISAKVTLPTTFALHQNYPNPFNPSTSFAVDLPKAADYTLSVYNISGQLVRSFTGQAEAGTLKIVWDGTNTGGTSVASGVYLYSFHSSDFNAVRKMVLMK